MLFYIYTCLLEVLITLDVCNFSFFYVNYEMFLFHEEVLEVLIIVWTNATDIVSCTSSEYHLLKHETHHSAMEVEIHNAALHTNTETSLTFRDFMNADYNIINEKLLDIDWTNTYAGGNLQTDINKFYDLIEAVIADNVTTKLRKTSNHPKWFDHDLISMKNKVNKPQNIT